MRMEMRLLLSSVKIQNGHQVANVEYVILKIY